MIEGSSSTPRTTSTSTTTRPQHYENNDFTTNSTTNDNHQSEDPSQRVRQRPTTVFQTPSSQYHPRDRPTHQEQQSHHHQHSVQFGSPFASPPISSTTTTTRNRQSRSEAVARQQNHQQHHTRSTTNIDSPFLSPQLTTTRLHVTKRRNNNNNITDSSRKSRPEPLVLDPSDRTSARSLSTEFTTYSSSDHRRHVYPYSSSNSSSVSSKKKSSHNDIIGNSSNTLPAVQKLFQVATMGLREHHATAAQYSTTDSMMSNTSVDGRGYLHATPVAIDPHGMTYSSAASFARSKSVVQAGFLQKLGKNIPEFKRRFFVLKPETNLYYYLSPNETEPRGKIDLEGSSVEQVEQTPDGRFRFIIVWNNDEDDTDTGNNDNSKGGDNQTHQYQQQQQNLRRQIVLEARSKDVGEEWIRCMKGERVSSLKEKVECLTSTTAEKDIKIADLEQQLQNFRMIEADRDGALEDARNWKKKFKRLDEGLRLLTQQVRKPPPAFSTTGDKSHDNEDNTKDEVDKDQTVEDEKKEEGEEEEENDDDASSEHIVKLKRPSSNDDVYTPTKSNLASALLDDFLIKEDMDVEEILEVPGTYFSGLSNACQQQRESLRLASVEASTAVEDVVDANERVDTIQKRMGKAEKHILKLWEENCTIRKTLKQKKREKRVLVREVKQLQLTVKDLKETCQSLKVFPPYSKESIEDGQMEDTMIGSDEERLIIELEEHVASSIRLHERLIGGNDFDIGIEKDGTISIEESQQSGSDTIQIETNKLKILSLLDDESESESSSKEEETNYQDPRTETGSIIRDVKKEDYIGIGGKLVSLSHIDGIECSPNRFNPLLKLDESDDDEHHQSHNNREEKKRILYSTSKHITENGQATSRLVCPLADVVETNGYSAAHQNLELNEDLRVYHLTFYSTKIGLQFQKASPAPIKPRGLLTNAFTDDLVEEENSSNKTAAELRSVASISSLAAGGIDSQGKETCPLALPEDIVLVCGFDGFDNSGVNRRPKLGARLVAFDGVSVEVGKWTFDSIRKSIKSRGRPLTLSFRNDFLTTEQRTILIKAIKDVEAKRPPVRPVIQYERPQSTTPSLNSGLSHESDHFLNNTYGVHLPSDPNTDLLDTSTVATEESNCWIRRCPSSTSNSISSIYKENRTVRPSSSSVSTHKSANFYSFSEAGSVSSSFAPMMTNLLKRVSSSDQEEKFHKYEKERRFGSGINPSGTPQHQDFQSNLL